ncbi:hypothetical protein PM082_006375 [Marasmius tenuissimus]|nr:hypothetical protein PM082_006375 [Marasmius tenuissimus]
MPSKLLSSIILAILYAGYGYAAPRSKEPRNTEKYTKHIGRDLTVEVFHPESEYKTLGKGIPLPESFAPVRGTKDKTVLVVTSELGVPASEVSYTSGYQGEAGEYGYAKQLHDGIPINNAVANVAIKDSMVVALGHSFVDTSKATNSTPTVDVNSVIPKVEQALDGKRNSIPPTVEYVALQDGSVALVHVFQVQNDAAGTWYAAHVDAHSGELLSVTDFVSHATYKVLPVTKTSIAEGLETVVDPEDLSSSPLGWHTSSGTLGNNGEAYKIPGTSGPSSDNLIFNHTYDPTLNPTEGDNTNAALINAFYVMNSYHDTLYHYGFTEAGFNFQYDNFGKGGLDGDGVDVSVQDPSGMNNAKFSTPPDGQIPICRMFIWDKTSPNRDGALENDILIHELTHGLTNRMTGGGTASCLQITESRGLGEGWSDALADWFAHSDTPTVSDFLLGAWVSPPGGVRTLPYSTSQSTNPYLYSEIKWLESVHDIGEVWYVNPIFRFALPSLIYLSRANILHNVYAALVDTYGWSPNARTDPTGSEGNVVWLHLFVDALALQPCNPMFPHARAAWIQADENRYGGAHKCLLWKVFASRGLGVGAQTKIDSFEVPDDC